MSSSLALQIGDLVPNGAAVPSGRVKSLQNSKVRSCLYVGRSTLGFVAQPFYSRRGGASQSSSTYKISWSNYNYGPKREYSVGSEKKPLVRYDPNHPRSKIRTPFMPKIEQNKVGDASKTQSLTATPKRLSRQASDFNTTYRESYEQPSKAIRRQNRKL